MRMKLTILAALAAISLSACKDDGGELGPPDLSRTGAADMGVAPDMPAGCAAPSDTCVANPMTADEIINGCVEGDVVKIDVQPYFPTQGYDNCTLPPR